MKNARTIGLVMLIVVLATSMSFAAKPSKALIVNSLHDLRSTLNGASFTVCNFCHVADDRSADTKQEKVMARMMIGMVHDINAKFPDGKVHVTCFTCHRGSTEPLTAPPAAQ